MKEFVQKHMFFKVDLKNLQYSQENTWLKRVPKEILTKPFCYKIPLVAASGCPVFQWSLHCALKQILENKTLK